ncbi:MAG: hypothetical protein ACE5NA_04710, partial [Nitrospiraceae bacterium]
MAAVDPSPLEPALAPPDQHLIRETLKTKLPFRGELAQLIPLAGDASNRRYFRIELAGGSPRSLVLMQLANPEPFKQSEEAVSRTDLTIPELPFVNIHRHLAKSDVAVPALYHYDQSAGLLYLEDFGDLTMTQACQNGEIGYVRSLYRQAIDGLIHIQVNSTRPADPSCLAFHRSFDVPLLMWEFDHFLEYGVVARSGKPMCAEDFEAVRAELLKIA